MNKILEDLELKLGELRMEYELDSTRLSHEIEKELFGNANKKVIDSLLESMIDNMKKQADVREKIWLEQCRKYKE